MPIRDDLETLDFFKGLDGSLLDLLAAFVQTRTVAKGEAVFADGDACDGFYAVLQGQVRIYKMSPAGREHILHVFGPGEAFGEVAVFKGLRFPAHAQALRASRLAFIPREPLKRAMAREPELALGMLGLLSLRLLHFVRKVEELGLKEVPARLAAHLLLLREEHPESQTVTLDMAKGQLATYLGTIPETLSRILKRLADQQLIALDGHRITLLDPATLAALASGEERLE
ncbi:MAG: Crp/Fnr family transcriptional regulator [Desulfovibrionaceae bacterium]|jgi:CRP/FNR family transcriptional regulator|nr:Crp/Fnr family transcriptional regulator [Desulfovibrionaceae bacterium]